MEEVALPTQKKALYIGAGLDLSPVQFLSHIKEFIYVDSLPRTSTNSEKELFTNESEGFVNKFKELVLELGFVLVLEKELVKYVQSKFSLTQSLYYKFNKSKLSKYINPTLLQFANVKTGQIIKYYVSTLYPDNISNELTQDINTCDSFIYNGYDCGKTIISQLDEKITFFAWTNNKYHWGKNDLDGSESKSLTYYLGSLNNIELSKYFKQIIKVNSKTGQTTLISKWNLL
jgi:hypothetical protein